MAPILARRTANRDIRDGYGDRVEDKSMGRAPTGKEKRGIRHALNMRSVTKFPKCPGRDYHKAEGLDREAGYTLEQIRNKEGYHTLEGHVCPQCQCQHVAGRGTRGYWYWTRDNPFGYGEVGHYGVGYCYYHSPLYSTRMGGKQVDTYRNNINSMIEHTRQMGIAPDAAGGDLTALRGAAAVAEVRMNTKIGLQALFNLADKTLTQLREHDEQGRSLDDMVKDICEVFGMPPDMLDEADRRQLLDIYYKRPLTELARGVPVSMSSKTSIQLQESLLKNVVQASKSVFETHEDNYTPNDEVVRLLERFYSQAEIHFRAFSEEEWTKFLSSIRDIGREFADRTIENVVEGE